LSQAALPPEKRSPSLTSRLLRGMVVPMAGLAILLGVGGAWAIEESVEAVNDRVLDAAARAIADSMTVADGKIIVDPPTAAIAMLEDAERVNAYFKVSHSGQLISGNADLPSVVAIPTTVGEIAFGKNEYRGHRIRLIAEVRQLPGIDGLVTVQVAEPMEARERELKQMFIILALLEALLIGVSAVLIPVAVRWALAPLKQLRSDMDRRSAADFTPLPLVNVPAELRDFVGTFNSLLGRLDAAVQGMRRFTADASHQMRTPLSILRAHLPILKKVKFENEEAKSSLADIDHATERLQNLLVQLLALARADSAAPMSEALESIDIVDTARQVANEHVTFALQKKAKLQFESSAKTILVHSHPTLAFELLSNLLDNAIRYNKKDGVVRVAVSSRAGVVKVVIEALEFPSLTESMCLNASPDCNREPIAREAVLDCR
jgi:two-component system, OmpR family, sensor histidine kinase TctE